MFGKCRLRSLMGVVLTILLIGVPAMAQDTRSLFREGYDLYIQGNHEAALAKFKDVLARDPSHDDALWMRDQVSWKHWGDLLASQGEGRQIASRVLELATMRMKAGQRDDGAIQSLIGELRSSDYGARTAARRTLAGTHGAFAVPYLLPALASEGDDDFRIESMYTLSTTGSSAVLPLMEALKTDNEFQRANVASVLGNLRDHRAVPALQAARDGASDTLRGAIDDALGKIGSSVSGSASDLFVALADAYYDKDPAVLTEVGGTKLVWDWADGSLSSVSVPAFLYPLLLAEGFCHDALALDSSHSGAWVLLARSWLAQAATLEARQSGEDGDPMADLQQKLDKTRALAAAAGVDVLAQVATTALAAGERDLDVAAGAIELLGHMLDASSVGRAAGALHAGIADESKTVRYSAAIAISRIHSSAGFDGSDTVVAELARALGEPGQRLALVISGDDDVRNAMLNVLNRADAGLFAVGAASGLQGLVRAKGHPPFDVIVCDASLPDILTSKVVDELRGDYRTASVPVIVLTRAANRTEAQNQLSAKAAGFVVHEGDGAETVRTVSEAITSESNASRARATALATAAAEAMAELSRGVGSGVAMDESAVRGIKRALTLDDSIRIPCIQALGHLGYSAAEADLAGILGNTGNSSGARAAAATALGLIAQAGANLAPESVNALKSGLAGDAADVRGACGRALGMSSLNAGMRAEVLSEQRVAPSVFSDSSE